MASIISAGVGSGLDVASLVSQLVAAERNPAQTRINTRQSQLNVELSALGTFKGALSDVQAKLDALKAGGALSSLKSSSSAPEVFTAKAGTSAAAGRYDIEVVSLARAHKLASAAFVDGPTTSLGNGDVTISVGGDSFKVTLSDGANTLADLRRLINDASDNTGVTASLVNEENGTRLMLTAVDSGTDNTISVTSDRISFTEKQAAANAHLRIEGYDHYAQSNNVTGAIDGVTINLLKAEPGQTYSLELSPDTEAINKAVTAFVNSYNAAVKVVASLTKYDAEKRQAAALNGDGTVRGAMQALRNVIGGSFDTGAYRMLSELGIKSATDGTLTLDSTKFSEALTADRASVQKLFEAEDGLVAQLGDVLDGIIGSDGQVEAKTESMQARLKDLGRQQDSLDLRMERVEARYRAQFTALDTLIARMNTTSSYLSQQLSALANMTMGG